MKPLNQNQFNMKIIEDLGMLTVSTIRPTRFAMFECTDCGCHFKANVQNSKKRLYCNECQENARQQAIHKPLVASDYKLILVKDLGNVLSSPKATKKARCALFECPKCHKQFTARASGAKAKTQESCYECTLNLEQTYKHPLYAVWNGIKQRCYNPKRKDYHNYGGKGITMCDEWKDDFNSFYVWCLSNGWEHGLEVDKDVLCRELNIAPAIYSPSTITFLTGSQNSLEARGKQVTQYTLQGEELATFESVTSAKKYIGTTSSSIAACCRDEAHTAHGFIWKYT